MITESLIEEITGIGNIDLGRHGIEHNGFRYFKKKVKSRGEYWRRMVPSNVGPVSDRLGNSGNLEA